MAGQETFTHRQATSPSRRDAAWPQDGHTWGKTKGCESGARSESTARTTSGMTSPARWTTTRSPILTSRLHILLSLLKANNFEYYKWLVHFEPTIFYCYNITEPEHKKITLINSVIFYILSIFICPYDTSVNPIFLYSDIAFTLSFTTSSLKRFAPLYLSNK